MSPYAQNTDVTPDRSRAEIERTLRRYQARGFMYGTSEQPDGTEVAVVAFLAFERQVRFQLPLPGRNERQFTHTAGRGQKRTPAAAEKEYEQAVKQKWRALLLVIKALLEAVDAGILTFDDAFLAHIMLPNGTTVSDTIMPSVVSAYETGEMPSLLPEYATRKAIEA